MPLRFSRFQGSKLRSINELNQHINLSNCTRYIEPFAGSCSIYLNLNQSFIEYIISDKNIYTYKMYLAFKEGTFEKYNNFINDILKTFGDIKFCKECYYNYREWYNEVFFRNVNKDYIL